MLNPDVIYEKVKPIFEAIKHPVLDFKYNSDLDQYISTDSYNKNDMNYIVIIKNDGSVVYGDTDGVDFFEEGIIGKISL